jgi:Terminase RNaseH-like domain
MSKYVVMATWDDAPHLTQAMRDDLWSSIPVYQREARSKGIPSLGSGAIYPVAENDIIVPDFPIPDHWPRAWALDTGWNWTAAVWGALNRETQTIYAYAEYKRSEAEPAIHAAAIKAKGPWIPGVGDAAAINNYDGRQFIEIYRQLGLDIALPDKAVESGIHQVWQAFSAGKLKIFQSLTSLREELRLYRRDEKGRIVKENDHLCDTVRYLQVSGKDRMIIKPAPMAPPTYRQAEPGAWMGR